MRWVTKQVSGFLAEHAGSMGLSGSRKASSKSWSESIGVSKGRIMPTIPANVWTLLRSLGFKCLVGMVSQQCQLVRITAKPVAESGKPFDCRRRLVYHTSLRGET